MPYLPSGGGGGCWECWFLGKTCSGRSADKHSGRAAVNRQGAGSLPPARSTNRLVRPVLRPRPQARPTQAPRPRIVDRRGKQRTARVPAPRVPGPPARSLRPARTSNCQWAACSSCFAWSAAQPAASTNWLIMTWCRSSSMFTDMARRPREGGVLGSCSPPPRPGTSPLPAARRVL